MNHSALIRILSFVSVFVIAAVSSSVASAAGTKFVRISIPSLSVTKRERVVGFDIQVRSGRIARVKDVPTGWEICLHNEPSWRSRVSGAFAAASMAVNARFFRDFIVVERDDSNPEVPFDVQGEIIVSADFATERRIKLSLKDFSITKITGK